MRAVLLREIGPPENLRLEDLPDPAPGPGQVLVRVRAAGVCYRDVVDRRGGFPLMKRPVVPGHEFAGEVAAVGERVERFAPGDRVVNLHRAPCGQCDMCRSGNEPRCPHAPLAFGLTADGAYAEYIAAPEGCLVSLPASIPFERGCFLACTAAVALRGLETRGRLRAGETVLVTGASGGVGLHGLQVARALGARTVAVTSSADKAALLRDSGADEVLVAPDLAFHRQARALGIDLVLDCVGVPTLNSSMRSVKPLGRIVVAGNVTPERAEVNPGWVILNEVTLTGSSGCTRRDLERVLAWVEEGAVRPVLAEVLSLERAADAHRRLEERGVVGRLVLSP
jgi:acryloyl-coenzyme A reductase